jgi:hypothetical protein
MTWSLTAKSGPSRGESWMIGPRPIVLGRSLSCDIAIGDPTVSRRHCEVKLDGDGVVFRDLGSRNVTLVNGRAVETCRLLVGDELSLGTESFILTRTVATDFMPETDAHPSGNTTVSLEGAISIRDDENAPSSTFPATVPELLRLFNFGRKLSRAHNEPNFAALCIHELEETFPARIKPSLCCWREASLSWYPEGFTPSEDLLGQVMEVMEHGDASITSFRAKRLFFKELVIAAIAPFMVAGRCHGALVIQSVARDYIPEPVVLMRLNAIAQTASPYLGSLENRRESICQASDGGLPGIDTVECVPWVSPANRVESLKSQVLSKLSANGERQVELKSLENAERTLVAAVLAQCHGDSEAAARILGLPVSTLEGLTMDAKHQRAGK